MHDKESMSWKSIKYCDAEKEGTMNNLKRMILVCAAVCLVFPAYAAGAKIEEDPWPVNFAYTGVFPDYTHGQYLCLTAVLRIDGALEDFKDVMSVKVKHEGTGWETDLVAHKTEGSYNIRILPQEEMYEGTWQFTLKYKDQDGDKHSQTVDNALGEVAFPPPPFHIRIWLEGDFYKISWSGIGDPAQGRCDYRVRIFYDKQIQATFVGEYKPDLNLVIVVVPIEWEGYSIQIENRFSSPRSEYTQLNRAMAHGKLLPKSIDYD